jgi:hypothetical protein
MHGYLIAPQTGGYTFWIATDDSGALYLSTDEAGNAQLIAWVNGWTPPAVGLEPNQRSAVRPGGQALLRLGLDEGARRRHNLAVRWGMPNGTDQAPIVLATPCLTA